VCVVRELDNPIKKGKNKRELKAQLLLQLEKKNVHKLVTKTQASRKRQKKKLINQAIQT